MNEFSAEQERRLAQLINARLKTTRHVNSDHLDRALLPIKIKPGTNGQVVSTNSTGTAVWSTPTTGVTLGSATPVVDGTATVGVSAFGAHEDHVHPTDTSRAPTASPTFTGTVTIPTAGSSTSPYQKTEVDTLLALKAPLASPTFTGTVTVPTVAIGAGTNAATIGAVNTALGSYLTTATASTTYLPLAGGILTGDLLRDRASGVEGRIGLRQTGDTLPRSGVRIGTGDKGGLFFGDGSTTIDWTLTRTAAATAQMGASQILDLTLGTVQVATGTAGAGGSQAASQGYVETATGSASSNRPAARLGTPARSSDNTSTITTGSDTLLRWNAEAYDTDAMHDLVTNPSRITMRSSGTVNIEALVAFSPAATTGNTYAYVAKNGTLVGIGPVIAWVNSGVTSTLVPVSIQDQCVAGDYYEVFVNQSTGVDRSIAASASNRFSVSWTGGTGAAWGNAGAQAYHGSTQTTSGTIDTWANLALNNEIFDIDGEHDTVTNNSRLTCVTTGTFVAVANIEMAFGTAEDFRGVRIRKNGATINGATYIHKATSSVISSNTMQVVAIVQLSVGDYLEAQAVSHVASQTVSAGSTSDVSKCSLSAVRVGYQTNPSKEGQLVTNGRQILTSTWSTGSLAVSTASSAIMSITVTGDGVNKMEITADGVNYLASAALSFYFQLWDSTAGVGIAGADQQPPQVNTRSSAVVVGELAPFTGSKTITLRVMNYTAGAQTVAGDATSISSAKPARLTAKWIPA